MKKEPILDGNPVTSKKRKICYLRTILCLCIDPFLMIKMVCFWVTHSILGDAALAPFGLASKSNLVHTEYACRRKFTV